MAPQRLSDQYSGTGLTLRAALEGFLVAGQARGLSPKTLVWYRMIGERFAAYREAQGAPPQLAGLSAAEARAWVLALQAGGLAPVSVAGFVRGLKAISSWWAAEEYLPADPLRRLARPRAPQRLIATLTPAELERLLGVARARERLLIGILLDTGLRLGELADLRLDDVLADGYLRVRGKGRTSTPPDRCEGRRTPCRSTTPHSSPWTAMCSCWLPWRARSPSATRRRSGPASSLKAPMGR